MKLADLPRRTPNMRLYQSNQDQQEQEQGEPMQHQQTEERQEPMHEQQEHAVQCTSDNNNDINGASSVAIKTEKMEEGGDGDDVVSGNAAGAAPEQVVVKQEVGVEEPQPPASTSTTSSSSSYSGAGGAAAAVDELLVSFPCTDSMSADAAVSTASLSQQQQKYQQQCPPRDFSSWGRADNYLDLLEAMWSAQALKERHFDSWTSDLRNAHIEKVSSVCCSFVYLFVNGNDSP